MEKGNDKNTVLLTVIGIATLLVAIVGATFAYFTASVNYTDATSTLYIKAAAGGTTEYTGGEQVTLENIYPRTDAWAEKVISLTYKNSATELTFRYKIDLVYTNTLASDYLTYTFEPVNSGEVCVGTNQPSTCTPKVSMDKESGDSVIALQNGEFKNEDDPDYTTDAGAGVIALGQGSFVRPTASGNETPSSTHVYKLTIRFPQQANVNQNGSQDKRFTAYLRLTDLSA